jgi:hypothetical protein
MTHTPTLLIILTALFSSHVLAAPELKPGKWRITSSLEHPMMPTPQEQITEECITHSRFDFEKIMSNLPTKTCKPIKPKTSGNKVSWSIDCVNPMNPSSRVTGTGNFQANGTSGDGMFTMNMAIPGLGDQSITSRWRQEYLGKCD